MFRFKEKQKIIFLDIDGVLTDYSKFCLDYGTLYYNVINPNEYDFSLIFGITKEENDKIKQWISNRETKDTGAIGGRYEYRFFPTGIGIICKIVDTTDGESFVFRDI